MAFAIDSASMRPMKAIANAPWDSWASEPRSSVGMCGVGRLCGTFAATDTADLPSAPGIDQPASERDERGDDQHGQQVDLRPAEALHQPAQHDRHHDGRHAQYHRAVVDRVAVEQGEVQPVQHLHVAVALVLHAERVADLPDGEQEAPRPP